MLVDEQTSTQAVCSKAQVALRFYLDSENLLAATSTPSQALEARAKASSAELHASLKEVERYRCVTAEDIEAKLDVIASVCDAFGEEYPPLVGLTLSTLNDVRRVLLGNQFARCLRRCGGAHDEDCAPFERRASAQ